MTGFGADLLGWTDNALAEIKQLRGWTEHAIERLALEWDAREHRVEITVTDETFQPIGRLRYIPDPRYRGNGRRKMLADEGGERQLFPAPETISDNEAGGQLLLTEGEPDTIAAWSYGFAAVAVPGTGGWQPEYASRFAGRRWTIYIVFDCDNPGRRSAHEVADALTAAGIDARIFDLDQTRDDKYDLTDYLLDYGATALPRLLAQTPPWAAPAAEDALTLHIVPLPQFAAVQEEGAKAILGTADNAIIPEGGDAMIYGDGGVGKTTLMVDLALHLAAGDSWLGLNVPAPVRVLLVENEGPRPLFRRKLERKLAGWAGSPIDDRVQVLEEPWGELSFADGQWRAALARELAEREIDVLIVGPVTNAGMDSAGTITEARAFITLVQDVRAQSGRPIAVILVHHENKGGKVSGAWEGTGDTLLHVQQQGHGQIRLYFQKARWASDQHATTLQLKWAEGDSFAPADDHANRPEQVWETLEQFVLSHPGCSWKQVMTEKNPDGTKLVRGQADYLLRRRDQMLTEGVIVNIGHGRGFELWHRDDPARPTLPDD